MSTATADAAPARGVSPRKRAQRIRVVQYVVLVLVVVGILTQIDFSATKDAFFRGDMINKTLTEGLGRAIWNTIRYTLGAFVLGLVAGTVLALMRLSQVAPYRWISGVYIEFFRGLPALLVLLIFNLMPLALPGVVIPFGTAGVVWLGLGIVASAYMAETIRAGIQAVPKGQLEAARSLGMSPGQANRKVVLPQAFRIILPPLTNELILLVKDSSLVYILGLDSASFDLTKYGRDLANTNANLTPLIIVGLGYLIITVPLTFLVRRMEARQARAR